VFPWEKPFGNHKTCLEMGFSRGNSTQRQQWYGPHSSPAVMPYRYVLGMVVNLGVGNITNMTIKGVVGREFFICPRNYFFSNWLNTPPSSFLMRYVLVTCYVLFETVFEENRAVGTI